MGLGTGVLLEDCLRGGNGVLVGVAGVFAGDVGAAGRFFLGVEGITSASNGGTD